MKQANQLITFNSGVMVSAIIQWSISINITMLMRCNATVHGNQSKRMYDKVVRKYKMKFYIFR